MEVRLIEAASEIGAGTRGRWGWVTVPVVIVTIAVVLAIIIKLRYWT